MVIALTLEDAGKASSALSIEVTALRRGANEVSHCSGEDLTSIGKAGKVFRRGRESIIAFRIYSALSVFSGGSFSPVIVMQAHC